jgi:hypothetical protein
MSSCLKKGISTQRHLLKFGQGVRKLSTGRTPQALSSIQSRMIRRSFLAGLVGVALGLPCVRGESPTPASGPPVDFHQLPWADGEALRYLVSWHGLDAAQGTFVAHDKGTHWEFKLALGSCGLVDDFYPFSADFWSILAPPPWRSVEYGEDRFEPKKTINERTRIDYARHLGTREIWARGKTMTFPITEDAIDDVGTMLYHLRTGAWNPGDHRLLHLYESDSEKEATAECEARETRAFGTWPRQPLLRILVLPGKGTHHRGRLMLWMTDDSRRLPVHADLDFRYGTFSINLVKADRESLKSY